MNTFSDGVALSAISISLFWTFMVVVVVLASIDTAINPANKHSNLPERLQVAGGLSLVACGACLVMWAIFSIWGV